MAISLTPYPSIPAGYSSAGEQATSVKYTYVAKQGYFTINVNGLMPSTLHSVYFEGKKVVSANVKPLGGKWGDSLYTDSNGKATFTFYYQSSVITDLSAEQYNEIAQRIGGDKELIVANSTDEQLSATYTKTYTSYAKKNILFKTTKNTELPVRTDYSFAYPPALASSYDYGYGGSNDV
jgi:hypothetical protein